MTQGEISKGLVLPSCGKSQSKFDAQTSSLEENTSQDQPIKQGTKTRVEKSLTSKGERSGGNSPLPLTVNEVLFLSGAIATVIAAVASIGTTLVIMRLALKDS
ncbi:hypothetical protein BDZ45DRAFT_735829 [Acephala macrosclerotiorum]|nr:hypothetical protein BDZ45DRAFT_735829 [Acephala macrosclerotiorum]